MKACNIQRYDKTPDVIGIYILSVYPNHMMYAYSHPLQAGIGNVKSVPQPLVAVLM
jgi:hypothetical protein